MGASVSSGNKGLRRDLRSGVLSDLVGVFSIVRAFFVARVPDVVLCWRGGYLDGELQGGEQVDEFVECEFVDVGLE